MHATHLLFDCPLPAFKSPVGGQSFNVVRNILDDGLLFGLVCSDPLLDIILQNFYLIFL